MASGRRRTGLLLGAGTSMAANLPGLIELTTRVQAGLKDQPKDDFERIVSKVGASANIETILNRVRLLRELLSIDPTENYEGISSD